MHSHSSLLQSIGPAWQYLCYVCTHMPSNCCLRTFCGSHRSGTACPFSCTVCCKEVSETCIFHSAAHSGLPLYDAVLQVLSGSTGQVASPLLSWAALHMVVGSKDQFLLQRRQHACQIVLISRCSGVPCCGSTISQHQHDRGQPHSHLCAAGL